MQPGRPRCTRRSRLRTEIGGGCMAEQLLGQWWAQLLDLGYILPEDKVQKTLHSIFKYNWKSDLQEAQAVRGGWFFGGAGDKGLINVTWPRGRLPRSPMDPSVWTGVEYEVAAHMIYEGMIEEGFAIVKGARDRYDGIPRPPLHATRGTNMSVAVTIRGPCRVGRCSWRRPGMNTMARRNRFALRRG